MEKEFSLTVTDITMREYLCAVRHVSARRDLVVLTMVPVAFLIFLWNLRGITTLTFVLPVVLLAVMMAYFEIVRIQSYAKFPSDLKMEYRFDAGGWSLRVKEGSAAVTWGETGRLKERGRVFLLCQGKNVSNLLPKRCLTDEQAAQIRAWYKASR